VRFVPSGPFIVVNMGFGVTRTPYWAFILGLAIGAACKIIIVSLGWQIILDFFNGQDPMVIALLVAAMVAWIGLMLLARRWLRRNRPENPDG
ncbi:MAG: TVP38/TMEM64 family protein, partial [Maricaulis sp.]|nr:TVP38/TMEM64 family protein [Maricaulis sp.]